MNLSLNDLTKQERNKIKKLNSKLGVDIDAQFARNLIVFPEQTSLSDAGLDFYQRTVRLYPDAVKPWLSMQAAAKKDEINIFACSAFRDYDYQYNLISRKLANGQKLESIISILAPPGFSEHHTGLAIDIISDEIPELDQIFETTKAYEWLTRFASDFNFFMSYPKGNTYGIIYEPWHWKYKLNG